MGDRGRTSINEDREVFNLPPIEDGDRHFIRGEYRPVDSYGESLDPVEPLPNGNETLPDGSGKTVDKGVQGGIIEERETVKHHIGEYLTEREETIGMVWMEKNFNNDYVSPQSSSAI